MKKRVFLIIISIVLFHLSSAEVILSHPKNIYNKGDLLEIKSTIETNGPVSDFFIANLVCENKSIEVFRKTIRANSEEKIEINLSILLDYKIIGELSGFCYLFVDYDGSRSRTSNFEITKKINVYVESDNRPYEPKERINIRGRAVKANGQPLNGFLELQIASAKNLSQNAKVENGEFSFDVILPEYISTGEHTILITAYEKDNENNKINEGEIETYLKIKHVVKTIEIALNSDSIKPENNLDYKILLYDQTGMEAEEDVKVFFYNPNNTVFQKSVVRSGIMKNFYVEGTYSPGIWTIEASYNNLTTRKQFSVEEFANLSFSLINDTLIVKNTGNVIYNKPIELKFGNETEIFDLNIAIGETKSFKIEGPSGNYEVKAISGGTISQTLGFASLNGPTGAVIGISEIKEAFDNKVVLWLWIAIIIVLLALVVLLFRKIRRSKKTYVGIEPRERKTIIPLKSTLEKKEETINLEQKQMYEREKLNKKEENITEKEDSFKDNAAVLVLKINNMPEISIQDSPAISTINSTLLMAKNKGAKIYIENNFRIIIFSPKIINVQDIHSYSLKIAEQMLNILKEHNKRYAQKIDFGIGLHYGELIDEFYNGKWRFVSWGNTIPLTKTLASYANEEIVISEQFMNKIGLKVKTMKIENKNYYRIVSFPLKKRNSEFIDRFMGGKKT